MSTPEGSVERLALGLAALGRPAYITLGRDGSHPSVDELRARCHACLDLAHERGVRWVDAARSYGRAEEFLAGWIAARFPEGAPADLVVSSKWGYRYTADWRPDADVHEVKDHSAAHFTTQLAETRALLGDVLGVYQVHSLTTDSPLFDDSLLLGELAALAADGVRVGFSTSGPGQRDAIERALAVRVDGAAVFTAVQSTWNVLETSAAPALAAAHDAGVHVLVKEPLANGRLAVDPPDVVADLAGRHAVGTDAIGVAAALDRPWADTVLLGAADTTQLADNLVATTVALDPADTAALASCPEDPTAYWSTRSRLPWS